MGFWKTFVLVLIMGLIIAGAYFTTRFLSIKAGGMSRGKYMDIIDRMALSRDRHIVLVRAGSRILVVGITSQNMNVLGELSKEEAEEIEREVEHNAASETENSIFSKITEWIEKGKNAQQDLKDARSQNKKSSYQNVAETVNEKESFEKYTASQREEAGVYTRDIQTDTVAERYGKVQEQDDIDEMLSSIYKGKKRYPIQKKEDNR